VVDPFAPNDYEECAETAAKEAKSKEALSILISSCASKFRGRRKLGGGYTYYDSRQLRSFDIVAPNPSAEEMQRIDSEYYSYLASEAEAARRAEEARQRAEEAKRQAAIAKQNARLELERRQNIAKTMVFIVSKEIECPYRVTCDIFKLNTTIQNRSNETISQVHLGWAFLPEQDWGCPSSFSTKTTQSVYIRPGDTITLNLDGYDGSSERGFRYCIGITGVEITPDENLSLEDLRRRVLSSIRSENYGAEIKWCRLAADKGDVFCLKEIGRLYMLGRGVQDDLEAAIWYRMAANRADDDAEASLGYLYHYGWGVNRDDAEAFRWFRMAAEKGNARAQLGIGLMTARGEAVAKDCTSAKQWLEKAAAGGSEAAPRARDNLRSGVEGACHW
jgi:TPR repeat protein